MPWASVAAIVLHVGGAGGNVAGVCEEGGAMPRQGANTAALGRAGSLGLPSLNGHKGTVKGGHVCMAWSRHAVITFLLLKLLMLMLFFYCVTAVQEGGRRVVSVCLGEDQDSSSSSSSSGGGGGLFYSAGHVTQPGAAALDPAAAAECWRVSCAATGVAADTYGGLPVKP